jgi:hypothetical protein
MKRLTPALLCGAICLASASGALGQQLPPNVNGYTTVLPGTKMAPSDSAAAQLSLITPVSPLVPNKSFTFSVTASAALGSGTYTGTILGRSPLNRGKTTTTIPTQLIPLVITINDGTRTITYDPTAPDTCVPGNLTTVSVVTGSPVFTNNPWTMNGVAIGNTQYIDAFQRAQFWSQVQGTPYHLVLNQSVLGEQALSFSPGNGTNYLGTVNGFCGNIGVVNTTALDNLIQALITGPLASMVNTGTFPVFLTKNVVSNPAGVTANPPCCVLGYHSSLFVVSNLQIYSIFSIDSTGVFGGGYTGTLSHEMAEAVNDPDTFVPGINLTPSWGNIGQVQGMCQANLEVGDPLSPGNPPNDPTKDFVVVGGNGLTYDVQELAYYSWFFGATPLGVGAGGLYSNNGTFHLSAYFCPPGTPDGGPY